MKWKLKKHVQNLAFPLFEWYTYDFTTLFSSAWKYTKTVYLPVKLPSTMQTVILSIFF